MKKMRKNKRGVSHIEMILSFVIFIGFLLFVFIILNPLKKPVNNDVLVDKLEYEVAKQLNTNLISQTIKVNDSAVRKDCFSIDRLNNTEGMGLIVKDSAGGEVPASVSGESVLVESGKEFYKLMYNDNFAESDDNLDDCQALSDGEYELGVVRTDEIISYDKILSFIERYKTDYEALKEELKLPKANDFAVIFFDTSQEYLINDEDYDTAVNSKIPQKASVSAKNINIQILETSGAVKSGILNLRVW